MNDTMASNIIQIAWRKHVRNKDPFYDFSLNPICSEIEHHIAYDWIENYYCEICDHKNIKYRCVNCEYSLCGTCHKDKCAEEELSNRFTYDTIRKSMIKLRKRLIDDKLYSWIVGRCSGSDEIYFYHPITNAITYEYPLSPQPPDSP